MTHHLIGESLPRLVWLLDYGSVLIFALTGALVASRQQLDPVGFIFMAVLTAVGGGTMRDRRSAVRAGGVPEAGSVGTTAHALRHASPRSSRRSAASRSSLVTPRSGLRRSAVD